MTGRTDGTHPKRRTVVIGEPSVDAAPGSGATIDPLIIPLPDTARSTSMPLAHEHDATLLQSPAAGAGSNQTTSTMAAADAGAVAPRTVVIGGDDELPDAQYTATSTRSPDSPGGPRVHPRLRARRIAVRQDAGRRRAFWTVVVGGLVLLGLIAVGVLATPLFAVSRIRYSGIVYTDQEQLAEITSSLRGKPIFTADLSKAQRRIEALPWVKYASVHMDFPHTVIVQIAERTPVAGYLGEDNLWRVIDIDGRVIDVLDGQPIDYPAIFGAGPSVDAGKFATEYVRLAQLITSLPPQLVPLVKVFEIDQQLNVSMTIALNKRGDTLVDLCSARDLDALQVVSLTAFINTKVNPDDAPPGQINACQPELITTSAT